MMLFLTVFLVLAMVVGAFAGDDCVGCSVGLTRGRVTIGGRGGVRLIIVRLVIFVFLDDDNLGRFVLFVLLLLGLFFVVSMIIVSLFMEEGIIEMRMQGLL